MAQPETPDVRLWRWLEIGLSIAEGERERWLRELAEREPDLAAPLARLLAHDLTGDGFLDQPLSELVARPGDTVGPYRLRERLGQGGNGIVFKAERLSGQPSYPVAIKVLWPGERPGAASAAAELEVLGALDHPGIGRMLDAGVTQTGTTWFAMELVDGRPIDRHCHEKGLPLKQRLELFLGVAAAVEHAHSRQVLHGDLKPSNVLVDAHGRPKLLDFGIARRLDTGKSETRIAAFTRGFASPEQLRGEAIGPAADVFGLGALLGRMLCEHSSSDLQGRLAAVLAKATAEAPAARYVSVSRFAEDVERFLRHRPVRARPAGLLEHLALACRRHRLATAAIVALALGSAAISWHAVAIDAERDRAEAASRRAQAASSLLLESLADLDPSTQAVGELSARELVERARRRVDSREQLDPATRAELLLAIGSLFGGVGAYDDAEQALDEARRLLPEDSRILVALAIARVRTGAYDDGEALAREALALRGVEGGLPMLAPLSTLAWAVLRNSRNDPRRLAEAARLAERATELARAESAPELELARTERLQAAVLHQADRVEEALTLGLRSQARLVRGGAQAYELAVVANEVALAEQKLGRTAAAIDRFRAVASELERLLGREHPEVADALNNLAIALSEDGRLEEAATVFEVALDRYERLLGDRHPMTLNCASSAATALQRSGDLGRAEALHRRVAVGLEATLGADHPFVPLARAYLAENLALQGRLDEATAAIGPAAATQPRALELRDGG